MKITEINKHKFLLDFTLRGRRIRKIYLTRAMADRAAIHIKNKLYDGTYEPERGKLQMGFSEVADIYILRHVKKHKCRPGVDICHIKTMKSFFKTKSMRAITVNDIEGYKAAREQTVAEVTTNRSLSILKHLFSCACDWEMADRNPARKVRNFKEDEFPERRILEKQEIKRLLDYGQVSKNKLLYPFLVVALNTGMRKTEILSLRWKYVDFPNSIISIPGEITKTKKPRTIPMNTMVIKTLANIKQVNEFVFASSRKKGRLKGIDLSFKTTCRKAGIEGVTVHALRHTCASVMINELNINVVQVQHILGHTRLDMTLRYIHLSDKPLREAIDKMGEYINQPRHKVDTGEASYVN